MFVSLRGLALLAAMVVALSGCVYKLDIRQGNFIDAEKVAEVEPGMTRSQVRFLLGTPMVVDAFHNDRWDYVFYYRFGKRGTTIKRRVAVHFEDDVVARIEKDGMPVTEEPVTNDASADDEAA